MFKLISFRKTAFTMLLIFSATLIYHLLILTHVVPYELTWGGRLKNAQEMRIFEITSIGINLVFMYITVSHAAIVTVRIPVTLTRILLWCMALIFLLNTMGNLMAFHHLEKWIFTPATVLLCLFSVRMALEKNL